MTLLAIWLWFQASNFELGWVLAGMGALAGGIGIFRAGLAVGHSASRITETFERFVDRHLENQDQLLEVGKAVAQGVPMLANIQTGQQELNKSLLHFTESMNQKIEMTDTSLAGMWEMVEERRKRSAN